ncbi:hypothetical protein C4573_04405 [Candidatus Woesearchaeota archaeon]|nr:MAG: hypothetical protein C4573_04405 [Candidatus Woesearchaeota archaeon]
MKGCIITHRGIEDIAALDVKELLNVKSEIHPSLIVFPIKKIKDVEKLSFYARSAKRVLVFLGKTKVSSLEKTAKAIEKIIVTQKKILKKSFCVSCERIGEHGFKSVDIEGELHKSLAKKVLRVEYKHPHVQFYIYIYHDDCYVSLDTVRKDLSRRDYKLFNYGSSLKGTIAYALLRVAGFSKNKTLLDPFCNTGTIPIEAALYQRESPVYAKPKKNIPKAKQVQNIYAFDASQKYLVAAKKNAIIAGVDFSLVKLDAEWLDTKFEAVDYIITKPIAASHNVSEKKVEKIYNDFFHGAFFIVKESIAIITTKEAMVKKIAKKYKWKCVHQRTIDAGALPYTVMVWKHAM